MVPVGNRMAHHFDRNIDQVIAELDLGQHVIFPGFVAQLTYTGRHPGRIHLCFPFLCMKVSGIPLLEAMSQNVPIVASDIPCLQEVAGDAAAYFDPSRVDVCVEICIYSHHSFGETKTACRAKTVPGGFPGQRVSNH